MKECMQDTEGLNRLYGINKYENHIFEPNLSYKLERRLKKKQFFLSMYVLDMHLSHASVERYEDRCVNFALLVLQVFKRNHAQHESHLGLKYNYG